MTLPDPETAYLHAVTDRLRELLGRRLTGVYPTGSVALDGYRPGRSDLDLIAVGERVTAADVTAVAAALDHEALPCPAAGLEFVLYDRAQLAGLTTQDGFTLNLNTGRELTPLAEFGPQGRPGFWYPIDRDITAQQDRALTGPPFTTLATRLPYPLLRPVVAASVAANDGPDLSDDAVLNVCRALYWRTTRRWVSKPEAGRAAAAAVPEFGPLITAAVASHGQGRAGRAVDAAAARAFVGYVLHRLGDTAD
ncbi:aminoglycoside adenylyltransferase domain-containing protein [Catellatospora paridis]|uniref:aminoglycoside adenylyltransferase domain-containing protein n=1 Tax=Catellatospora paridis TaxID=1617086 RepID=UPI0012D4A292|nr:aminoglycoside adenylyltransferase domain-containing protein [Catellatospora paridis]